MGGLARTEQDETNRHVSWTAESSKAMKTEGFVFQYLEKKLSVCIHTYIYMNRYDNSYEKDIMNFKKNLEEYMGGFRERKRRG